MIGRVFCAALVGALVAEPAAATSFSEGQSAYRKGQYEQSHNILRPLATSGNARAQFLLGRQYQLGQGVAKDMVKAWVWYRRAENNGHTEAALFRHLLERRKLISTAALARARRIFGDPADTAVAVARKTKPEKITPREIKPEIKARPRYRPVFAAKTDKARDLDLSRTAKQPDRKTASLATPDEVDVTPKVSTPEPKASEFKTPQRKTPDYRSSNYNRQSASRRPQLGFYGDDSIGEHTPPVIPQQQWRRPVAPAWQHRNWQARRWREHHRWRRVRRWQRMQRRYGGYHGPRRWRQEPDYRRW